MVLNKKQGTKDNSKNKAMDQNKIEKQNNVIAIIVSIILIAWIISKNVASFFNWAVVLVLSIIFITSAVFLDYRYKKGKVNIFIYMAVVSAASFIMIFFINMFLITKIRYTIWIFGILVFFIFKIVLRKDSRIMMAKEVVFMCLIMFLSTGILYSMNEEPYRSIRMKNDVRQYLLNTKHYDKESIKSMALVKRDGETQYIGVMFKDEPNIYYFYSDYKREVTQVEIKGQKIGKHKE